MKEVPYLLNIPGELHKRAKIRAVEEETTLKDLLIRALEEYLKKKGVK